MKNRIFLLTIILFGSYTIQAVGFELTNKQQIIDFTEGCAFYGAGGGGNPKLGQQMLDGTLAAGKSIRIVDINLLPRKGLSITPYLMGSSAPSTAKLNKIKKQLGLTKIVVKNMPAEAARLLLARQHVKASFTVPLEPGGANSASAVSTAAWLGIPAVDGAYQNRAYPEMANSLPAIYTHKLLPMTSSDSYGNQTVITHISSNHMAERIGKQISVASYGLIGQAGFLMQSNIAKKYILPGNLSRAYQLGKAIRVANQEGKNPLKVISKITHAKIIFSGKVTNIEAKNAKGYYFGHMMIQGENNFSGKKLKIAFQNEDLVAWLNNKPIVTTPALITVVRQKTGRPLLNSQTKVGMKVVVFALKPPHIYLTRKALKEVGPRHFGYDFSYVFKI